MPAAFQDRFNVKGSGPNRMRQHIMALNCVLSSDAQIDIQMINSVETTEWCDQFQMFIIVMW
jgi:hypothetical protein